ncbi:hypothetical protein DYQ93_06005 [Xanthomonas sp. LMG 8992]|uniref:hypothetical protein n=1 Tax=Xanthomonas sp. LMG 8992 TaxID=1591157 RepID=UPI001368AC7D|nr:hypothetical protein [Xanthomonas sp. LMG 8992]MXV10596.1 hypothetical protein [Xanthomonas sp. LMG 8992]
MTNEEEQVESVAKLYAKATENDWRTVQSSAQQVPVASGEEPVGEQAAAEAPSSASPMTTAETVKLMNVARSILVNENGSVG